MQHGQGGAVEIKRGIEFYEKLFKESSRFEWAQAVDTAVRFEDIIKNTLFDYYEEIRGKDSALVLDRRFSWYTTVFSIVKFS